VYIRPATPRLNGKVERSHSIDDDEFYRMLNGVVVDDTQLFNTKLQDWAHFYNFDRPHACLGGQTPYERLREKTRTPAVSSDRQLNIAPLSGRSSNHAADAPTRSSRDDRRPSARWTARISLPRLSQGRVPLTRLSHLASEAQQELGRAAELPFLKVCAMLL
jgi:Integrase core domain